MKNWRPFTLTLFGVLLFLWGLKHWQTDCPRDYAQFWVVGKAVKTLPVTNVYDWNQQKMIRSAFEEQNKKNPSRLLEDSLFARPNLELVGTPFLYGFFALISSGHFDSDHDLYRVASQLLFLAALFYVCWILHLGVWETMLFILASTVFYWAFKDEVWVSNTTTIQMVLTAAIIFLRRQKKRILRYWLAGLMMALGVFFKPTFSYVVFFLLIASFFKMNKSTLWFEGTGFILGAVIAVALPWALFGPACTWSQWALVAPDFLLQEFYRKFSFLYFLIGSYSLATLVVWNLLLISLPVFLCRFLRDDFLLVGMGVCCQLLGSPLIHSQYFLLLLIPLALLIAQSRLAWGLFLLVLLKPYLHRGPFMQTWPWHFVAVVLVYGCLLWRARRLQQQRLALHP